MATSDIKKGPLYVDGTNNRVGVGTVSPDTTMHIHTSSAGTVGAVSGGVLTLEKNNHAVLQFLTPNDKKAIIYFGDPDDIDAGRLEYDHLSNAMSFNVNAAQRMKIDSSGRVTMPYQPAFYVYNLNFPDSNSAGTASGGTDLVNIGSHYATGTGRFTAPISGTYMFTMMTQAYDSGNTSGQYQTAVFRKNGSNVGAETYHGWQPNDGNNHVQSQNTIIISLSANDYMQAYVQYGSRDIQNFFSGYLIG